ncbi:hypothetical protein Deba_1714 [Desulfarculus baarsii DSM 2075]|uniref:Uncharacterized protein n=1 Tax=Desulfarculus baarsii (strain ATCC 33931 / DSM 2075 / LMG 7858 / VKM B-1802 / 2st14) TaxID=644282 RepID=E1QHN9_DESB2|nr:hypothetical protein [Desulfarculus baarsii]ADK85082.1 hypothetical protein Deba_1714 [Desulfarculus baarsii DSM 2075]
MSETPQPQPQPDADLAGLLRRIRQEKPLEYRHLVALIRTMAKSDN